MKIFELKSNARVFYTTEDDIKAGICRPDCDRGFKDVVAKGRILQREEIFDRVCLHNGTDKDVETAYPWIRHFIQMNMTIMFITENGKKFIGMTHSSNIKML